MTHSDGSGALVPDDCPTCLGSGTDHVAAKPCPECNGIGYVTPPDEVTP